MVPPGLTRNGNPAWKAPSTCRLRCRTKWKRRHYCVRGWMAVLSLPTRLVSWWEDTGEMAKRRLTRTGQCCRHRASVASTLTGLREVVRAASRVWSEQWWCSDIGCDENWCGACGEILYSNYDYRNENLVCGHRPHELCRIKTAEYGMRMFNCTAQFIKMSTGKYSPSLLPSFPQWLVIGFFYAYIINILTAFLWVVWLTQR